MDAAANARPQAKKIGYALLITALSPLLPQILGSAFNIWYNVIIVDPLLTTAALKQRFLSTVLVYNSICYPVVAYLWLRLVYSLRPALTKIERGEPISEPMLQAARRRVIRLPFLGAIIFGLAWLLCIPIFIFSLAQVNHGLDSRLLWHLPVSFGVSGFISLTHSFFLVELASNWGLFPVLFQRARADLTPGAKTLSLRGRGLIWVISAGICPIGSLLLLNFAPASAGNDQQWLAVFVGSIGIAFGLCTAMMVSRLFLEPIDYLRSAAQAVARGRLDVEVPLVRADEFGLLIGEFNRMIVELREKERLRRTFGLHVGQKAAEAILARDPGLSGVEEIITVMFVDIRSFTAISAAATPRRVVEILNKFLPRDGASGRGATWRDGQQVSRRWFSGPLWRRRKLEDSRRRRSRCRARYASCAPVIESRTGSSGRGRPGNRNRYSHRTCYRWQHRIAKPPRIHGNRQYRELCLANRRLDETAWDAVAGY